ncbi:hypothetical protein H9623_13245 [Oerskovia sp. Sa1BUA8]|uniref:Capsid maturation protease n=1 Tax=Oerskovia douganii TaxID=2762210 RepID=A0A9D5YZJ2_9CELL|nr:hypothetical protein [Oerskovia douganii]MBE7701260.1 hypothetical protein [Oerskovia douganii]
MPVAITESAPFAQAATPADGPGRLLIRIISAGRGSSGVYPAETLKAAAEAKVFKAGTHMRIDHQTDQERYDRPEGSVWDTAAVLTEDAWWDQATESLVSEARVYSRFRTMLAEMAPDIGVSIRASAEVEAGDWDGEPARIITRLVEANTVDFVTRAGRGGHIIEVLEAARVEEARNVGQWVESRIHRDFTVIADEMFGDGRLTREERIALSGAIGEALDAFVNRLESGAPDLYTRDVWEEPPAATQAVEATPTDVPSRPAGQTTATESQEGTMATTEIEESRLAQLETDAGRATVLESERDTARRELAEAHAATDTATAARIIAEANVDFDELQTAGLLASAPRIAESGRLDTDAFTKAVAEHAAKIAEAQGAGSVRGVGGGTTISGGAPTVAQLDEAGASAFGRSVKEA